LLQNRQKFTEIVTFSVKKKQKGRGNFKKRPFLAKIIEVIYITVMVVF